MPRLRVLHVIQSLNYGGMERLLADLVRRIDGSRFESHVLALRYLGRFSRGLEGHAELHVAPRMTPLSLLHPRELAATIRALAPDVVHTHSGVWYKATLAARLAGVPRLVHTDHGRPHPDPVMDRFLDRRAAARTDAIVAVSEPLSRQLAAFLGRASDRIRVVPNGVRTDEFVPGTAAGALRKELGLPDEAPIVGSIGRLERVKGYDIMVRAFATLRAGRALHAAPPHLVIAGDGADRTRLVELARSLGVGDAVHLLGWRDDVHELQAAFTLFTMSSRSEGTSVSLLEAMSAGLCPVVTDVGGNSAVLGPELRHRLVPAEDPEALAAAWREALAGADARARDARAARRIVETRFDISATVTAYERIYGGHRSPAAGPRAVAAMAGRA